MDKKTSDFSALTDAAFKSVNTDQSDVDYIKAVAKLLDSYAGRIVSPFLAGSIEFALSLYLFNTLFLLATHMI